MSGGQESEMEDPLYGLLSMNPDNFDFVEDEEQSDPVYDLFVEKFESKVPRRFWQQIELHSMAKGVSIRLDDVPTACYFHGEVGTGKSHQLAETIRFFLRKRMLESGDLEASAQFIGEANLLDELRNCYDGEGSTFEEVREKYEECDLLCLDDLGVAQHTEWSEKELYRLVNHRYNQMKPTVFSSNYTISELSEQGYGDRIISRIWEMVNYPEGDIELTQNHRV